MGAARFEPGSASTTSQAHTNELPSAASARERKRGIIKWKQHRETGNRQRETGNRQRATGNRHRETGNNSETKGVRLTPICFLEWGKKKKVNMCDYLGKANLFHIKTTCVFLAHNAKGYSSPLFWKLLSLGCIFHPFFFTRKGSRITPVNRAKTRTRESLAVAPFSLWKTL